MQSMVRARGLEVSDAFREHCERRLASALGRFRNVVRVAVHVSDVNGPRGGEDILCRLVAHVDAHPTIVVRAIADDPYSAIDRAAPKLAEAVQRSRERVRRERVTVPLRSSRRADRRARARRS